MVNAVSLFANVGIAEIYLHEVGVNVVVANELLEDRARFYSHVYPDCCMIVGDVKDESIKDKIVSESQINNVEFVIATPPCQGMSVANHKKADNEIVRNSLVVESIHIIKDNFIFNNNILFHNSISFYKLIIFLFA